MGKRLIIILSVILLVASVFMGYFFHEGRKSIFSDPYSAISPGACILIETIDLQSFLNSLTTGKGLFGEASSVKQFENFNRNLKYLADHMNDPAIRELIADRNAVIAFFPVSQGELKSLLSIAVPSDLKYRHVKQLLASSAVNNILEREINDQSVLEIPWQNGDRTDTAFISINSGLLLLSNSGDVIRETQLAMSQKSDIKSAPGFSRILLASGKNEDKIFIVFPNLIKIFKPLLSWNNKDISVRVSKVADVSGGDIFINDEGFVLSGYTESSDSSDYLFRYKNSGAAEFQTYKILPSETALFETTILPDNPVVKGRVSERTAGLALKMQEFMGDEITRAYIDIRENKSSGNNLIIYMLKDPSQAEQIFLNELQEDKDVIYFQPDDQVKIPVYRTPFSGMINSFLPGFTDETDDSLFAFYDNYLITGSSYGAISRLLYDNLLNNTLANDLLYRDFESSLPSRAGYFFFCVPSRIINYLEGFLNDELIASLRENRTSVNKIQAVGYKLAPSNGMLYNSLSVRFREDAAEKSLTEWETLLDTSSFTKPFFFTNHLTGAKEIFIQDLKNNACLINAAGRILWKVPLSEKIVGNVYMIDYYGNGKNQLLFSSKNYIHLLDRNGNYVERYPVKLRSSASGPLSLFDYENNGNYRLFIPGDDRLIYSYDKSGSVVKGWNPYKTAGLVQSSLNYFQVSGKDYITASDDKSIYLLDRYGTKRVNFKEPVIRSAGSSIQLYNGAKSFLVCSAPDGTIQQIYFDGTIKKFNLRKFSPDHIFDMFDLDGDGFEEYIFIDRGILYLYDHNQTELFSKNFDSKKLEIAGFFSFSADERRIGLFDGSKNLIYLIDKNGDLMKGFPLRGTSLFSIGKLSDKDGWNLIVGGPDRFLYNYKIDTGVK